MGRGDLAFQFCKSGFLFATISIMKPEVLNALLTARTLLDIARRQCFVRDRHVASAGLVVLQDGVELVLYACLLERGVDQRKSIEKLGFDELIGEIKHLGLALPKSGTLKAMNKQRVLVKHHAQLAEPLAVRNYYEAALFAVNQILVNVIGSTLQHVVIADAVLNPEARVYIEQASQLIEDRHYFEAMISIRKALFLAVEADYDVRKWADHDAPRNTLRLLLGGAKAPFFTRNAEWIQKNVVDPVGYVQLDHAQVRADMIELGIDPEEFFNVWRLTPSVYPIGNGIWAVKKEARIETAATEEHARYCLDVVVAILVNQQSRKSIQRWSEYRLWRARLLRTQPLFSRASTDSETAITLKEGETYNALYWTLDFAGQQKFVFVYSLEKDAGPRFLQGFIPADACELEVLPAVAKRET